MDPITREEMYLSAAAGETSTDNLPEPVTREEFFLKAIVDNGGGGGGGGGYTPQNYSTTEQDTGQKFVDGKSIYWITFTDISSNIDVTSLNIDTLIDGKYSVNRNEDDISYKILFGSSLQYFKLRIWSEEGEDFLNAGAAYGDKIQFLTIYYTKKVNN